jgi:2-keto-4-pentenoate hydratase/2-oxohepta-3-ene-1,7-dioic acid hydratase in catechol pathway
MRLITFVRNGSESVGAFIEGDALVVDLGSADPAFTSMLSLIEGGDAALKHARAFVAAPPEGSVFSASECRLLSPLPRPTQIRDCLTFPAHLEGAARVQAERMVAASPDPARTLAELEASGRLAVAKAFYDFPLYYISNRMAISGPNVDVEWPPYSQTIDYEMEWAAVIGKECRGVTKEKARPYIFGYTIFNDWSARDEQFRAMQAGAINLGPARGKDFCNGVGPCIVTADEIPDPYALDMIVRVNGEEVSRGSSSGMYFKFEDLLAFLSEGTTLYPGELICSGTVGGGCSFETGQTLNPGDVIELEVQRIGTLRNRVVAAHIKR